MILSRVATVTHEENNIGPAPGQRARTLDAIRREVY
jgi:hypothetical protein